MSPHRTPDRRLGRRGQAAVEFALIVPVFLVFLFSITEFGRAYVNVHVLHDGAREGARIGTLPDSTEADVQEAVDLFLNNAGLGGLWSTDVTVSDNQGVERAGGLADAQNGDRVEVTVNYDYEVLSGTLLPWFQGTVVLHGRSVFRHE